MESAFKVFVVDDDPAVRSIICAILEPDYPVDAFESAEACAAQLETTHPDLILLDINLPGMDGFQVKTRLEADPVTRDIPVIAISANVLSETVTRGKTSGFHGYLTKPINIEQFVRAMSRAVQPR